MRPPHQSDLLHGTVSVANRVIRVSLRQLGWAEGVALRLLKQRLDRHDQPRPPAPCHAFESPPPATARDAAAGDDQQAGRSSVRGDLGAELSQLLATAVEQSSASSEQAIYRRILSQLVPDEAAMLAALASGGPAALVHVLPRAKRAETQPLENASSLGRRAGVASQRQVPLYLEHLLELGLVEPGPEEPGLELEFEILMAETIVRDAIAAGKSGVAGPRIVRQTVRLSELGQAFWAACSRRDGPLG
jgi:hypothetical protein